MVDMEKLSALEKTIEVCLLSTYLKNEKPISLMIVAKPESGKTQTMKQFRNNSGICYLTDVTAHGIQQNLLPKISTNEIRTLMIADFLTPISKSTKTRKSFIAFINNLIEEGVAKIQTYAMSWDKEVNCNIITAVTDQELRDSRHDWAKMGFLSRFLVFSYQYPMSTVNQIFRHFASQKHLIIKERKLKIPKDKIEVKLPEEIAQKLIPFSATLGQQQQLYGFRTQINFQTFLKALALSYGRTLVNNDDLKEFESLANYFNLNYNVIV